METAGSGRDLAQLVNRSRVRTNYSTELSGLILFLTKHRVPTFLALNANELLQSRLGRRSRILVTRSKFAEGILIRAFLLIGIAVFGLGSLSASLAMTRVPQLDDGVNLEVGKAEEGILTKGLTKSYRVSMRSGEYLRLGVTARGVGVTVILINPSGAPIFQLMIGRRQGVTPIHFIGPEPGAYRVEIRADEGPPSANYQVRIDDLRTAKEQDNGLVRAQEYLCRGEELRLKGTNDSLSQAVESYKQALDFWTLEGDLRSEAETLRSMGLAYFSLHDFPKALDQTQQALSLWKLLRDKAGEAEVVYNLGKIYFTMGDRQKARDHLVETLQLARSLDDIVRQGDALNLLGITSRLLGDPQRALEYYNESLRLARNIGDQNAEATLLGNMGVLYGYMGDTEKALVTFKQALDAPQIGDARSTKATIIDNLGKLYNEMGEKQKALQYLNDALHIRQELADGDAEANSLNSIALVYASLGDNDKALELFNRSLMLARGAKDRPGESTLLYNIGKVYLDSGNDEKALQSLEGALSLNRAMSQPEGVGRTLQYIGRVHAHKGEWQEAIDSYDQALSALRSANSPRKEASALNDLGAAYAASGRVDEAYQTFSTALSLSRAVMEPSPEASALAGLARIERGRGKLVESRSHAEAALQIAENIRAKVSGQELRVSYFASVQDYYRLYSDVLAQLNQAEPHAGYDVQAFEASERMRARGLLDLLNEAGINIREGVDPQLLEREHTLRKLIEAKSERQIRLLSGRHTDEQAEVVKKELNELITQFQEVEGQIRATSPRYAALTQPRPLTAREVQEQILDGDTTILEYALGEQGSYVWVVTQSSLEMVRLRDRIEIEDAAKHLYGLLSINDPGQEEQRLAANRSLSELLLQPIAEHLHTKRLLIVADGALQYLPFGVLFEPQTAQDEQSTSRSGLFRPLIADHEIVNLPSASTLAVLRNEMKGRKPAAKVVAVLADPVFSRDDPRVPKSQSGKEPTIKQQATNLTGTRGPNVDLERSARESGVLRFDRLLSSRKEAKDILKFMHNGEALEALDFRANRVTATSEDLGHYRIVHFASHALLNVRHPDLSGIVLSLVDEEGRPQDGFLRLEDIYNLKLDADLVVLSACETALGKEVSGEGLLGLTRGFMYAGTPRVVASLWKVPDKATAELMKQFYRGMLVDHLRPAAALRAAQVAMTQNRRWAEPYYWAAFALQGEWQ